MSAVTGGFQAVVQLDQAALQRIVTAMHRAGSSEHSAVRAVGENLVELLLNVPTIVLDPTGLPGEVRASARSRVLYHERPISSPADLGTNAVCDATVRTTLRLPGGDPASISSDTNLQDDWSATAVGDIVVYAGGTVGASVRSQLLDFIHSHRGVFELDFLAGAGISQLGARVIDRGVASPIVAVGINFSAAPGSASANLTTSLCQTDWAFAISSEHLINLVTTGLNQELSGLPPPYGPAPVLLQNDGYVQVYLDSFVIAPTAGAIVLAGVVRRESGGPFGTLTANWTANVSVALGPGQTIVATASQPAVQLREWYAVVGNWISGQQIERAISESIGRQLAGGVRGLGANALFSDAVGRLSSAGLALNVPLNIQATAVEIRPDALVVHGNVDISGPPPIPQAKIVALQGPTPPELLFHAGASWCPGSEIAGVNWDFGDGSSQQQSGSSATLVANHAYVPGEYVGCVTITDLQGRTARACAAVEPGSLVIELVGKVHWEFCKSATTLQFRVRSSGSPIGDASVTVSGIGWRLLAVTDRQGQASITVDAQEVESKGISLPKPSPYHLGAVRVTASKPGWAQRQVNLWMVDCDALTATRLGAETLRRKFLDRLAGYATLRDLRKRLGQEPTLDDLLNPRDPPEPRKFSERQIEDAIKLLTQLESLVQTSSSELPTAAILGVDPNDAEVGARLQQRFTELWDLLDRSAREHDQRFGPTSDRPPG